jgi:hypothetical protein
MRLEFFVTELLETLDRQAQPNSLSVNSTATRANGITA